MNYWDPSSQTLVWKNGPIFTEVLLADELNGPTTSTFPWPRRAVSLGCARLPRNGDHIIVSSRVKRCRRVFTLRRGGMSGRVHQVFVAVAGHRLIPADSGTGAGAMLQFTQVRTLHLRVCLLALAFFRPDSVIDGISSVAEATKRGWHENGAREIWRIRSSGSIRRAYSDHDIA